MELQLRQHGHSVELILFVILLVVLLVRVGALQQGRPHRGALAVGARARSPPAHRRRLRRRVSTPGGVVSSWWWPALLPLVLDVGHDYLMSQVCIFAVIALSLTVLTGWAGQVSLGQFGLVAVGAIMAAHLGTHCRCRSCCSWAARSTRARGDRGGAARPAGAGALTWP